MEKDTCNFCRSRRELVPGKKYCLECNDNAFKECKRCHLPYDSAKYYELSSVRCNSCQRKYEKETKQRKEKRRKSSDNDEHDDAKYLENKNDMFSFLEQSKSDFLKN